ncbi:MAG: hypothetical protein AAB432_02530 [Patescibacteria group bacterium]
MNLESKKMTLPVLLAIFVFIILAVLAYYFVLPKPISVPVAPAADNALTTGSDLGSALYSQSSNPIQDKLPDTVSPIPNPLENAYKNPFE